MHVEILEEKQALRTCGARQACGSCEAAEPCLPRVACETAINM